MRQLRLGLKLYSTDTRHAPEARSLVKHGVYSYVELFAAPGSIKDTVESWRDLGVPYVIHAAHSMKGLNPAKRELKLSNKVLADEAIAFADALSADYIIFHPGVDGPIEESIEQLRSFSDPRILVENKPREGLDGTIFVFLSPKDISRLLAETGYGFCLDFGHAHCAAVSSGETPEKFVCAFLNLGPTMCHMTDGLASSATDRHDRYGFGTLPLGLFLPLLPEGMRITNEGGRTMTESLAEAEEDAEFLRAADALSGECPGVEMKRARPADVDSVFKLSNDPEVRAASFSADPIRYDEHVEWFEKQLSDVDVRFFVFLKDGLLVGQTRFRRESEFAYLVGVSVSEAFRGSGYAKAIMRASLLAIKGVRSAARINAYIKKVNAASLRYFAALGFEKDAIFSGKDRFLYAKRITKQEDGQQ